MVHALIIGGTGMLSPLCLYLEEQGYHTSVVARSNSKMSNLIKSYIDQNRITPILVDYTETERLMELISDSIKVNGEIDLCISWIHPYAKESMDFLINKILLTNKPYRLFHILNSRSDSKLIYEKLQPTKNCLYRQIQLGFIINNTSSRWLTHKEITNGSRKAIEADLLYSLIGTIIPWSKRPKI